MKRGFRCSQCGHYEPPPPGVKISVLICPRCGASNPPPKSKPVSTKRARRKCPRCGAATYRSRCGYDICSECAHTLTLSEKLWGLRLVGKLFGRARRPIPPRPQSATATKITREKEQVETEYQYDRVGISSDWKAFYRAAYGTSSDDGVGILFDWKAIGDGKEAWQVFCESCDAKNLVDNTVLMTDVESQFCTIEIKALTNRQHAFCIALPAARGEQVNYVHNAVLSNAAKFLLPETPFVNPFLVGPWGSPIGSINFEGVFTLHDGDFLWVLLGAAKAKWNCSVSTNELNRFLRAVKSCSAIADDEMAIYAHAIGAYRLDQALANFRSDYSRSLTQWSEDQRPARQRECDELIARLKRAASSKPTTPNDDFRKPYQCGGCQSLFAASELPDNDWQTCTRCGRRVETRPLVDCPTCRTTLRVSKGYEGSVQCFSCRSTFSLAK